MKKIKGRLVGRKMMIIIKMTRWKTVSNPSFLELVSYRYLESGIYPSDTNAMLCFLNTKNIRNPLIFQKNGCPLCFWRVPRSQILSQTGCIGLPDLLTLVASFS